MIEGRISDHISYNEAVNSYTAKRDGIDNTPNEEQLANMKYLAEGIFEPLREHFSVPLYIPSFFRSEALNQAIGGATGSQHTKGEAMDIDADRYGGVTNGELFKWIYDNLEWDQLIWEYGDSENPNWIHVSYISPLRSDKQNRKQTLEAYKDSEGKTKYREI